MKLFSYNSIKLTLFLGIIETILITTLFYELSSIVTSDMHTMLVNSIKLLIIGSITAISIYFYYKFLANSLYNVRLNIHQKITKEILNTSLTNFNTKDSGEYVSLYTNDGEEIIEKNVMNYLDFSKELFTIVFFGLALLKIHYLVFATALVTFSLSFITPKLFEKKYTNHITNTQNEKGLLLNKLRELIQGFNTFVENNKLNTFNKKQRISSKVYAKQQRDQDIYIGIMNGVLTLVSVSTLIISTLVISYLISKNYVTAGALVSGAALMSNFNNSVMQAMVKFSAYKASLGFIKEKLPAVLKEDDEKTFIKPLFKTKNILNESLDFDKEPKQIFNIEMNNISLKLGDKEISFNQDFIFEKGKKYAIVGKSGCGKSTLLKVLTGEISNYNGDVIVDKTTKEKDTTLFNSISYYNQQTYLFNDTIENNITFNRESDEIDELLTLLELSDFTKDTLIEENGKNLSGGQKQRLGLARTLYSNNNIIILDEATNALDKETRLKIENYILNLNKTVIMISHHLDESNEKLFDKIYKV